MADPHFTPLGTAVKMFFTEVIDAAKRGYKYRKNCRILLESMNKLQPHIDVASQNSANWDKAQSDGLKEIKDLLDMVRRHATNCIKLEKRKRLMTLWPRLTPDDFIHLQAELDDFVLLEAELDDFVHLAAELDDVVHLAAELDDVVRLTPELHDILRLPPGLDDIYRLQAELDDIVRRIEKAQQTLVFVAALENLPCVDALEKIESFVPQQLPSDIVGLDVPFNKLKASIHAGCAKDKPSHLGLQGIGGVGKTLVAQMLHNDEDIIEKYGEQLEYEDIRLFEIGEEPATEECASHSTSTTNQYQMEPAAENLRSPLNPVPNYDIFLSYSEEEKDFAKQLYMNLKSSNYNLLIDEDSNNTTKEELFTTLISEASEQCQLAIIVLSKGYLTSKRSMLELRTLLKWKGTNNPTLKLCPLFYKLTPSDLHAKKVEVEWGKSWKLLVQDGKVQEEEIVLWSKAVKSLLDAKNGELERTKALLEHLIQGKGNVEEFCSLFSEVVKDSWACDGLDFKEYGNSEVEYLLAVVEKICNNMPPVKESNTDEILGYQRMLEIQSKLSLQKMKSLLENEPLWEKQFLLRRGLNNAKSLQDKYIEWNTFEEMCSYMFEEMCFDNMSEKNNKLKHYGRGRITAALFPNAFLYYFKAMMLYGAPYFVHDKDYLPLLIDAANMVAKRWKDLGGHEHQSFYIDVDAYIDVGCISYLGGIVAMCKNCQEGQEVERDLQTNIFRQYGIVQDDMTGIYYCGRVEADLALGEPIHAEATGVIGVKLTSESIHVEDLREDGSYYSGTLEDFSCEFGLDKNKDDATHKQCASKAFGDFDGARFLKKGSGMKCSPLLIIALASATRKKVLKLAWNDKYGHIKIDPNLPGLLQSLEPEVNQCEILFTDKINELGMAVEWGMNQAVVDSQRGSTSGNCNQVHQLGGAVDKGKKQIAYDPQRCDTTRNSIQVQNSIAMYQAASQNKKKVGVEAKGLGSGASINWEMQSSQAKKITEQSGRKLIEYLWRIEGGYVERIVLHNKHEDIKALLLQGALFAAKLNYLVVYDNNREGHVSIYCVKDGQKEDELEWLTDIFLEVKSEDREKIFKLLKGRDLTIKRSCTDYTIVPAYRLAKGSPSSYLSKFFQEKIGRSKNCIVKKKLIELPEFGSRSNNEWEHFIGPQEGFTEEKKFWWEATFMEAIVCSRTRFSTGNLMTTGTTDERFRRIGHCRRKEFDSVISDKYTLGAFDVETRGKFSKAPASQRENYVKWGGLSNLDLQ